MSGLAWPGLMISYSLLDEGGGGEVEFVGLLGFPSSFHPPFSFSVNFYIECALGIHMPLVPFLFRKKKLLDAAS